MTITEWAAIGSFLFSVALTIIGLKVRADVTEAQGLMYNKIDKVAGECQDKIREVELFTRDNFVKSALFDQIISLLSTNMESQFSRLQSSIDRLNDKIDKFSHHG